MSNSFYCLFFAKFGGTVQYSHTVRYIPSSQVCRGETQTCFLCDGSHTIILNTCDPGPSQPYKWEWHMCRASLASQIPCGTPLPVPLDTGTTTIYNTRHFLQPSPAPLLGTSMKQHCRCPKHARGPNPTLWSPCSLAGPLHPHF